MPPDRNLLRAWPTVLASVSAVGVAWWAATQVVQSAIKPSEH